ncbi:MAG: cbb3-type cytochrome c oxidase subunit 3 [Hyphomonadaceae bacterium]|nr:cbb3-type cytochrome c oxidase subunit 3 [Hyphomonadaceae bacterium]
MTYEQAAHFAQTGGLVLLAACFGLATIYALWPGNKQKFNNAARSPLENGDDNG